MAENIIIEISADAQKLTPVIDQLVKLGQVSAKDAEEFKKIAAASQTVTTETLKTTEAVKASAAATTQASAIKETALAKEIARLKELQTLSSKAADPVSTQRFAAAIKDSETRIKSLNAELNKTPKPIKDTDTAFKSLRTQLLEARNEAVKLAEKFGEFSPQAIAAANAAAKIDDKVKDLNRTLQALNPEQKLGAFLQIGTGISGAFTAAQGAMALFGSESEDVQKALLKVQGALALTQGLQSVLGLKDAFRDLRILLGITAVAQNGLTTATVAGAAATNTASVATKGFIATLVGSPLLPIILALGALTAAYIAISRSTDDAGESQEEYNKRLEETNRKLDETIEKQNQYIAAVNAGLSINADELLGRIATGLDISTVSTKDLTAALAALKEELSDISPSKTLIFDPDELLTADQITQKQKEIAAAETERLKSAISQIEALLKSRDKEVKAVERLKEEIKLLQNIGIDFSQFDRNTRAVIKLFDEFATAAASGRNAVNDFRLKLIELSEASDDKFLDNLNKQNAERVKANKSGLDKIEEDEKAAAKRKLAIQEELNQQIINLGREFSDFFFESIQNSFDANIQSLETLKQAQLDAFDDELKGLQELNENKIISDGKYAQDKKKLEKEKADAEIAANKKIAEEKRKAFLADRAAALARVIIDTALAITKTASELGYPAAIPFIALAAASGAIQTASILSQPIPKFKGGVIGLQGKGTETSDSIHAMLSKGESVMTARETKLFMPTLSAIRKNLIPAEVLNKFVVDGKGNGIAVIDSKDMRDLKKIGKRNPAKEADMIGRSVARHLNKIPHYDSIRNEWVN